MSERSSPGSRSLIAASSQPNSPRGMASTHLVLIPSYNSGAKLIETVRDARAHWTPVWVVVDGSTDESGTALSPMAEDDPGLRVIVCPRNRGKGAAILEGLRAAAALGFTHALTMDADGQHPAAAIPEFMAASMAAPRSMILGVPIFDDSAPRLRVVGRRVSNFWANLETLWCGVEDSLFGFRVYPIPELPPVMETTRCIRRVEFCGGGAGRLF